ncbi:hypothetical protein ACIBTZ_18610 [Micromonospora sp. NPDC049460]
MQLHKPSVVLNVDIRTDADADKRLPLGRQLLRRLGAMPAA